MSEPKTKILQFAKAAIDKNAENIRILNLSEISSFTDFFIICSARSSRQVQAIADSIAKISTPTSIEGYSEGRWILLDFSDIIVHIFLDELRDYYDLEGLWSKASPVKIPAEYYGTGASFF